VGDNSEARYFTCAECQQQKEPSDFTQIKGTPYFHRKCKTCRAHRARLERAARRQRESHRFELTRQNTPVHNERADVRVCPECGDTKPLAAFLRITGTRWFYRRCRTCRNARIRTRYRGDVRLVEAERARARAYKQRRRETIAGRISERA
jgi:hypothetical protein